VEIVVLFGGNDRFLALPGRGQPDRPAPPRKGVYASQYLTPDRTASQMAALAVRYFDNDSRIVDACCGTGQLTHALILEGVHPSAILGFDTDAELVGLYERLYPEAAALRMQFHEVGFRCENVIANPPFEIAECVSFLQWLSRTQCSGDRAVLLLPYGFIDKPRPKSVQETMRHFIVRHRTPMQEPFARTACRAGDRRSGTGVEIKKDDNIIYRLSL